MKTRIITNVLPVTTKRWDTGKHERQKKENKINDNVQGGQQIQRKRKNNKFMWKYSFGLLISSLC